MGLQQVEDGSAEMLKLGRGRVRQVTLRQRNLLHDRTELQSDLVRGDPVPRN